MQQNTGLKLTGYPVELIRGNFRVTLVVADLGRVVLIFRVPVIA